MATKTATVQSGQVTGTHTNFPAYVDLADVGVTTLAEAESIRVYSDAGLTTELAREIVSVTEMHVKIPSMTSSTQIWIDYDGVRSDYAVGATYGAEAVWSDYDVVYHIQETSGSVLVNSTGGTDGSPSTLNDGSVALPTLGATGQIENGADMGTSAQKRAVDTSIPAELTAALADSSRWTQQFWFRVNGNPNPATVWTEGDSSSAFFNYLGMNTNGTVLTKLRGGSTAITPVSYANNVWHMIHWTKDADQSSKRWINAANLQSPTGASTVSPDENIIFGGIDRATFVQPAKGLVDEFRLRKSEITGDWVITEYNNQNDNPAFWGTWTDAGGGGGITKPNFKGFSRL